MKNYKSFLVLGSRNGSKYVHIYTSTDVKNCIQMYRGNGYRVLFCRELKNLGKLVEKYKSNSLAEMGSMEIYRDVVREIQNAWLEKDLEKLNVFTKNCNNITEENL